MPPKVKTFILIVLLFVGLSSGRPIGNKGCLELTNPHTKVIIQMKVRKLTGVDAVLDYETGPNTVHVPPRGRPGGKGGNSN